MYLNIYLGLLLLPNSTFGNGIYLFIGFFWDLSQLRSSDLILKSPNDTQMTSRDQEWPENITSGHAICHFTGFSGAEWIKLTRFQVTI